MNMWTIQLLLLRSKYSIFQNVFTAVDFSVLKSFTLLILNIVYEKIGQNSSMFYEICSQSAYRAYEIAQNMKKCEFLVMSVLDIFNKCSLQT